MVMDMPLTSLKKVIFYQDAQGQEPFNRWFSRLNDRLIQKRILARLRRIEQGNYGDYKPVGAGVFELRFFFGAGYRIYFGEDGDVVVVLLTGGDKGSQSKDIEKAKQYWEDYKNDAQL